MDMIEYAGNTLDKHDLIDSSTPGLVEVRNFGLLVVIKIIIRKTRLCKSHKV